jgi:CAAX protease family protein
VRPVRSKGIYIVAFFIIAYSISWAAWIALFERRLSHLTGPGLWLYLAAVFAPHASALINTAIEYGRAGVRAFYRLFTRRPSFGWGLVAIFVPPAVSLTHIAIALILHLPHDSFLHRPPRTLLMLVFGQLAVVLGEEPGWRGFALPRLTRRFGPNIASLILGVAWALWHWPLFAVAGTAQYGTPLLPFAVMLVAWSMVMTLIVIRAHGSVVAAMLFHASANLCSFTMWEPGGFVLALGPWLAVAGIAAWMMRRDRAYSQDALGEDASGA